MIELIGPWKEGFAFDLHTVSSLYIGDDQFGHPIFDTKRTVIGQLLYELKYGQHEEVLSKIAEIILNDNEFCNFMRKVDIILPVPPSNKYRKIQPVRIISKLFAERLNKKIRLDMIESTNKGELKNTETDKKYEKIRRNLKLMGDFALLDNVLIFDDVFDSGSTLKAITNMLLQKGCKNIYVFTLTKTRKAD